MIEFDNTEVFGWEAAIRGMRNPMNSWSKSDSGFCNAGSGKDIHWSDCAFEHECSECSVTDGQYVLGKNDLKLMKKLVAAGTDHSKFMRMINVTMDITAPLYWWKEYDTYKVGTVRNSCSTMHKIAEKEFTLDDFSHEHLKAWQSEGGGDIHSGMVNALKKTIEQLNHCRKEYLRTKEKNWWWQIIQLLPSSYNQRSTMQMNYQVLRSIYHARKNHKLDEWREFCHWIEGLPYSELITMGKEKNNA